MYAIVKTGGKQYKVAAGDILVTEKLQGEIGDKVELQAIARCARYAPAWRGLALK